MSEQDSTRPDPPPGLPDHDPAGTTFPRIPLPSSADVPALMRERHDEVADTSYEEGALDALAAVARALRADRGPEVLGLLRLLGYSPQRVGEVIVKLDRLGDSGGQQ
jgi:hypothetical protein